MDPNLKSRIKLVKPVPVSDPTSLPQYPVDLDLMMYQINKKNKSVAMIRRLILYIPFLIFVTIYMFFGVEITNGFWVQKGLRVRFSFQFNQVTIYN